MTGILISAPRSADREARRILPAVLLLVVALAVAGCRTFSPSPMALPTKFSIRADQIVLLSDVKIDRDNPLLEDLVQLRTQLSQTLELSPGERPVVIYLFGTEAKYNEFLTAAYPGLPPRRAYFVGTSKQLQVFTYWGDRIQEDLRHEFTHGLLHASLKDVPLWLDEGLAEYFEIPGTVPGGLQNEYVEQLSLAFGNGWVPDLKRLEQIGTLGEMQHSDYQEAWAWVHLMLNCGNDDLRRELLAYLQELRHNPQPGPLSERVARHLPDSGRELISYIAWARVRGDGVSTASLRPAFSHQRPPADSSGGK